MISRKEGKFVLNQERKDARVIRILHAVVFCCLGVLMISRKEGKFVLNQERKDVRVGRILLIFSSFLSWYSRFLTYANFL